MILIKDTPNSPGSIPSSSGITNKFGLSSKHSKSHTALFTTKVLLFLKLGYTYLGNKTNTTKNKTLFDHSKNTFKKAYEAES